MNVAIALSLLIQLSQQIQQISALIAKAKAEGRDEITEADIDAIVGDDDAARAELKAAIDKAVG